MFVQFGSSVVQAKVGISYVSNDNAKLDWQTENPGWNFDGVKAADQQDWNALLGRIQAAGGSVAQTQQFYSLLYKDFIQPNITSDVNGQYMGADVKVQTIRGGQHDQYGISPAGIPITRSRNCRRCSTPRRPATRRSPC